MSYKETILNTLKDIKERKDEELNLLLATGKLYMTPKKQEKWSLVPQRQYINKEIIRLEEELEIAREIKKDLYKEINTNI